MPDRELLLSDRPPSRTQVRTVGTVALLFLAAFLISLPFRFEPMPKVGAFIVVVDTALLLGDLLTATLLFSQAAVLRSRGLMALATGYLFAGFIIIPHVLTFPFAFSERGLLSAGVSTTIWLYLFWHVGLPTAVIVYATLKKRDATEPMRHDHVQPTIILCIAGAAALAALLAILATVGRSLLPQLMTGALTWLPLRVLAIAWIPIGLSAVAMGAVLRGKRAVLDIWLALVLWAWLLELLLVLMTTDRFGLGWYVGRISGLLSGVLVLLMLIAESNRLYARLVTSVTMQRREREGRLLTMNAIAAAMAHEVKQPLASMVAGAGACIETAKSAPSNLKRVLELLELIEADGCRAAEAVDGIRTMFVRRPSDSTDTDLNELIRETTALVAGELAAWRVTLQLSLDEQAPHLGVDRLQMKHVLLNLFVNAIEAMSSVTDRPRTLIVRSISNSANVQVTVEDSGPGIEAGYVERIFDTFFTTKRQGTGIGLSLSRSVIEAHDGRIWATTEQPFGATFHVELPQRSPISAAGRADELLRSKVRESGVILQRHRSR
jgi:signal transduction histidine kinase